MKKVAVLGSGIFGFVLARHISLLHPETKVFMYDVVKGVISFLKENRKHPLHLQDLSIGNNVFPTLDIGEAASDAGLIVAAIPAQSMRQVCKSLAPHINGEAILLNVAKALELKTDKRMSEIFADEMPKDPKVHLATLSGGMIAKEVAAGFPLFAEVACESRSIAEKLQGFLSSRTLKIYTNTDIIGVELAGAFKNVVSILAGISDGLGYGVGTKAALKSVSSAEIEKLAVKLGAKPHTFSNKAFAWEADLSTCVFGDSRNRYFGELIGGGLTVKEALDKLAHENKRAEGYATAKVVHDLLKRHGLELPLLENIYQILYRGKVPDEVIRELMISRLESID